MIPAVRDESDRPGPFPGRDPHRATCPKMYQTAADRGETMPVFAIGLTQTAQRLSRGGTDQGIRAHHPDLASARRAIEQPIVRERA